MALLPISRLMRASAERAPLLAAAYRSYRDSQAMDREPAAHPLGFRFVGHPAMEAGLFEPDEVALAQSLLDDADVFINVGANIGYYSCIALSRGRSVVAFEPVPGNLQYLYRNLRANAWETRAEVWPVAVGNSTGLVDIYGGGTMASLIQGWAGSAASHRQTVPLVTLDNALGTRHLGRRCFVLIDVEGAELGVLRGAATLLDAQPRPVWLVEVNIDEHQPAGRKINPNLIDTFAEFERRGYAAWLASAPAKPVSYDEIRQIARTGVNTLKTHNFVFAMPGSTALPT